MSRTTVCSARNWIQGKAHFREQAKEGEFAPLGIGFKAKRKLGAHSLRRQFAPLGIGFKAKLAGAIDLALEEFAPLGIGFKAKPERAC